LLYDLHHLFYALVDLFDIIALLLGGFGDLFHQVGRFVDAADYLGQARRRFPCNLRAHVRLLDGVGNQVLRVLRRRRALGRKVPDLFGHNRETLAGLSGPRRLNCRVEREDVRLERDVVYGFDDLVNIVARLVDLIDGGDHVVHLMAANLRAVLDLVGQLCRFAGHVRVYFCFAGDLCH